MLTTYRRIDVNWFAIASGFAAGALAVLLLAGQVYAWIQRRRIDLVGGVAC